MRNSLALGLFLSFTLLRLDFSRADSPQARENPLSGTATLSTYQLAPQKPFTLSVQLSLPSGYRAYSDKINLEIEEPDGFAYNSLKIEPQQPFFDENTKMKKMGIIGSANLIIPMEAPAHLPNGEHKLRIAINYQACTKSYCLFPSKLHLEIPFTFLEEVKNMEGTASAALPMGLSFEQAMQKGLFWTFLVVFLAGFLTSLTPCIFPIIPITIAVLGRHAHLHSHKKNLVLSLFYVLGIAITYAALGVFAAGTGALFGSFMNHPLVLSAICVIFTAMALSMFGLFELQAPLFIRQRFSGDLQLQGYHSAFIYGVIAGVVAGPCVGPVLVGILTFVAKSQNLWLGFWLLFDFAVGMGVLFIAIGYSSQITKALPKSGAWMDTIKHFFGVLMLATSFYYLGLLVTQRWWDGALGAALVLGGSYFGAFESLQNLSTLGKIRKGLCQTLIFIGAAFVTIGIFDLRPYLQIQNTATVQADFSQEAHWLNYSESELARAKQEGKPVLIDFWADWCGACKELEQYSFSKDSFKQAAKSFVLLKFDATNETDELQALRQKYSIVGLPTLIFYDGKGEWRKELTTTEFLEAPELVKKMDQTH